MGKLVTEKIKLWGIVQGVGFRPFVAKCADRYGMKGEVLNIGGLVDVVVTDTRERIDFFVDRLIAEKPVPAEIVHIKREELKFREFAKFTILDSDDGDDEAAMIPADLAMCPECQKEFYDENNPRYLHPFISCMVCGPRYTVIDRIPYDRHNTAMIDWPMCEFCEGEYTDRNDRRYHAQTISCHDCGPQLIYVQNKEGKDEYGECRRIEDSCHKGEDIGEAQEKNEDKNCDKIGDKRDIESCSAIEQAVEVLANGGVIAMKGVGGYNLIADPLSPKAVATLREIKHREQKPFAIMFKDIETVKLFCEVSEAEERLLQSSARPIILLEHKEISEIAKNLCGQTFSKFVLEFALDSSEGLTNRASAGSFAEIERSRFIGAFLPSMGAQHLLLDKFGLLIVTSANLSDMPIIKDEAEIFSLIGREPRIEGCLYNGRDIRVRVDDSVVRVIDSQPQMIRRSKGYAPVPLFLSADLAFAARQPEKHDMLLACGGQLKNSFALSKGAFSYISQYFGDLDSAENRSIYAENVERMKELFRIEPQLLVCDLHPLYETTDFAQRYSKKHGDIPIVKVQHHHAHVASVMAEHHLNGKVIGVSMDGTGYGTDGAIWGSEFLVCEGATFTREAHLKYVQMIGGDTSMKDAAKSALCYKWAYDHGYAKQDNTICESPASKNGLPAVEKELTVDISEILDFAARYGYPKHKDEKLVEAALNMGINSIKSSSMGRLFDAVSAFLGIKQYNDYEGQCAILLEDAAARALKRERESLSQIDDIANSKLEICKLDENLERECLALKFHRQIAKMICDTCVDIRAKYMAGDESFEAFSQVALTGGVFQNKILMEESLSLLRKAGFTVYYNISVSPNDGGIALGQNYIGMYHLLENKIKA